MNKLSQCYLCGAPIIDNFLTAYDRQFPRVEDYNYSKCRSCGLVFMNPLPLPEHLAGFYPGEYSPHQEKPGDMKRKSKRNIFSPHGSNRLLEVGCGIGSLLQRHNEIGWKVKGVEINPAACEICRARGLDVHCGTLLDAPLGDEKFDVIFFNHVIEHLLDPVAIFKKASELLAPEGRIILLTPNSGSMGFGRYRSAWYHLDAPRHIFIYGAGSLKGLCDRTGLKIAGIRTLPSTRIWLQSENIERMQGQTLANSLEERKKLIRSSADTKKKSHFFRLLMSPVCAISARLGAGENLRAELVKTK